MQLISSKILGENANFKLFRQINQELSLKQVFFVGCNIAIASAYTGSFLPWQVRGSNFVYSATAKSDNFTFSLWNSKQKEYNCRKIFPNCIWFNYHCDYHKCLFTNIHTLFRAILICLWVKFARRPEHHNKTVSINNTKCHIYYLWIELASLSYKVKPPKVTIMLGCFL